MEKLLRSFQKKLTNLSGSNRSLLLLKKTALDLDLNELDFINNTSSFSILEDLLSGKQTIDLCPVVNSRDEKVNTFSKRIKKICRTDNLFYDERGTKDLYLGWPFVSGKLVDDTLIRCPLLFFPVEISEKDNQWVLSTRKEVAVTFNKNFLIAYAHFNKESIDQELLEKTFDSFTKDSQVVRNTLYQLLKESQLEINFNRELFENKLHSFKNISKKEIEISLKTGVLKLDNQSVIGFFSQSGSYQYSDYEGMIRKEKYDSIESFFEEKSPFLQTKDQFPLFNQSGIQAVKEEHILSVFPSDSSQEKVLKNIKIGKSLVVEGPPGTGKSQLICNLIADQIGKGKRVLVVCQKKAALDVINKRMSSVDLNPFLGLVHDFKNDRKTIFGQLASQVNKIDEYKSRNNGLDTIYLERNFLKASRKIDEIVEQLNEFKAMLFDSSECGYSVKELYLNSTKESESANLNEFYKYFTKEKIDVFKSHLVHLWNYLKHIEQDGYPWKDSVDFRGKGNVFKKECLETLDAIVSQEDDFKVKTEKIVGQSITIEDGFELFNYKEQLEELIILLKSERVYRYFQHVLQQGIEPREEWLLEQERMLLDLFRDGVEKTIDTADIGRFHEVLDEYLGARKNVFKRIKWRLFRKEKNVLKRAIVANDLNWNNTGFKILSKRLNHRLNAEHIISELYAQGWLTEVPVTLEVEETKKWFNAWHVAFEAKKMADNLRSFSSYLGFSSIPYLKLKEQIKALFPALEELNIQKEEWDQYLTSSQIKRILSDQSQLVHFRTHLEKDFDLLCDYHLQRSKLNVQEKGALQKLLYEFPTSNQGEIQDIFENSIQLAWIDHIEIKYPVLRIVSTNQLESLEYELTQAVDEKGKLSKDIVLLKLREQTYENTVFNRLHNRLTYRELSHQVNKKRKIWSIRKLIEHYANEVFDLIPCWLMSPESVSTIFPAETYFDLIIYDEASQCFVEKGFPAMQRAKQVAIIGDSKQLKPNDLYASRWEEEEEAYDEASYQIDSLLDFASLYLDKEYLTEHYRSNKNELISFSNQHFYDNKLRVTVSKDNMNAADQPIEYVKINGQWEKNTNEQEALKVVELVQGLLHQGESSIGVVTFNVKQQDLILNYLEQDAIEKGYTIPKELFVKNIENVQGDEREVIVFSIGYAPATPKGKVKANFGSLSVDGGENRLNVAITRAKKKIYLVTSILPQQLVVENTAHQGPKLLRAYLEYVYDLSEGKQIVEKKTNAPFGQKWYLKNKLKAHSQLENNKVTTEDQHHFSDLVFKSKSYFAAALTDDEQYFNEWSVKASHCQHPNRLKENGWSAYRIYSRNYWQQNEFIEDKLLRLLDQSE
ncbi:MAG: AAA domain-containing protein [Cyclobacteriaceae bacterium]